MAEMTPTMDTGVKMPLIGTVPTELTLEIRAMRRNSVHFYLRRRGSCSLGCDKKGEKSTYQIGHADIEDAGTWCPVHGWLFFDSATLLPTEQLTASELEDRRLTKQRKRGPRND